MPLADPSLLELVQSPSCTPADLRQRLRQNARAQLDERDALGRNALMLAASQASPAHVQVLLDVGRTLNPPHPQALERGQDELTALMAAVLGGEAGSVLALIPGSDLNARGPHHETALMMAAGRGDLPKVNALLDGSRLERVDRTGGHALKHAAQAGHADVVARLLDVGADSAQRMINGDTALIRAAWGGNAETVALLATPQRVLDRNREGQHALDVALLHHHLVAVAVLVARMPMVEVNNALNRAMAREPEVYNDLLGGMDLAQEHRVWGHAAALDLRHAHLRSAARRLDLDGVRAALATGGDPNRGETHRRCPGAGALTMACLGSSALDRGQALPDDPARVVPVVDLLLSAGADPDGREGAFSPLMAATQRGQWTVVARLLDAGASPDLYQGQPVPPPAIAARRTTVLHQFLLQQRHTPLPAPERLALMRTMLAAGADPNARYDGREDDRAHPEQGITPLLLAVDLNDPDLVSLLLDEGARIDPLATWVLQPGLRLHEPPGQPPVEPWTETGWTPLMAAAAAGKLDACRALIDGGADLHHRLDQALLPDVARERLRQMGTLPPGNRTPDTGLSVTDVLHLGGWTQVAVYLEERALRRTVASAWDVPVDAVPKNRPRL